MNTLEEIFSNCILDNKTGCWNWSRAIEPQTGYGAVKFFSKKMNTHRVVWILLYGKLDRHTYVCHHCDNRKCINPEHLFIGTQKDNMIDCSKKGRINSANNAPKGESHQGAKLTTEQVLEIRRLWSEEKMRIVDIEKLYPVCWVNIYDIIHRKIWKHV